MIRGSNLVLKYIKIDTKITNNIQVLNPKFFKIFLNFPYFCLWTKRISEYHVLYKKDTSRNFGLRCQWGLCTGSVRDYLFRPQSSSGLSNFVWIFLKHSSTFVYVECLRFTRLTKLFLPPRRVTKGIFLYWTSVSFSNHDPELYQLQSQQSAGRVLRVLCELTSVYLFGFKRLTFDSNTRARDFKIRKHFRSARKNVNITSGDSEVLSGKSERLVLIRERELIQMPRQFGGKTSESWAYVSGLRKRESVQRVLRGTTRSR